MIKQKLYIYLFTFLSLLFVFNDILTANSIIPDGVVIEKNQFKHGIGDQIGFVEKLKGKVIVIHDKKSTGYIAYKNMPLYVYDMIVTLKNSSISIKYNDGTSIKLKPETKISNVQFNYDNKTTRSMLFDLETGDVRFQIPQSLLELTETVIKTSYAMIRVKQSSDSKSAEAFIRALKMKTEIDSSIDTQLEIFNRTVPEDEVLLLNELERAVIQAYSLTTGVKKININDIQLLQNQFKYEVDQTEDLELDEKTENTGVYVSDSAIINPRDIDEDEIGLEEFDENMIEDKIEKNEKTQQEQQSIEVSEQYTEEIHEDNIKSMPSLPSKPD